MKSIFTLLFFISISTAVIAQATVGCYPLDNNTQDFSGNAYHGFGSAPIGTEDRNNISNNAMLFQGADYDSLPVSGFLLNAFTYSVWFKPTSLPSNGGYYSVIAIGGQTADQSILIGNNPAINHFGIGIGSWDDSNNPHDCYTGFLPTINQWYHVVFTRDNDSMHMYINDTLVCSNGTGNANAGYVDPQYVGGAIGSRIKSNVQNFVGAIDEVKIYDYVLSSMDVFAISTLCHTSSIIDSKPSLLDSYYDSDADKIILNNSNGPSTFYINDILGRKLKAAVINNNGLHAIPTQEFISGIYFITLSDGKSSLTKKIFISR